MSASRPRQTSDAGALRTRHTVETETTGRLHLDTQASITLPLPTHINYRATDPYAVEAVFTQEDGDVTWTFSRELLADGMHARAGTGDVAIWPGTGTGIKDDAQIFIELSPPSGTALVSLPRACVEEFLNQTTSIVPAGAEHTYISPTLQELERQLNQLARHPGGCE
ncbi:SsgA family sporulation/cell division regulator [Streptomyces virginiae]|uniref:SsgA family sporulation/cell division regulator n=1 Tax=Streptomyces virginiae TaxID=1961 RepID=UPI00324EB610